MLRNGQPSLTWLSSPSSTFLFLEAVPSWSCHCDFHWGEGGWLLRTAQNHFQAVRSQENLLWWLPREAKQGRSRGWLPSCTSEPRTYLNVLNRKGDWGHCPSLTGLWNELVITQQLLYETKQPQTDTQLEGISQSWFQWGRNQYFSLF